MEPKAKITIVGGGVAGCFMALALAKKNIQVAVYESRPDPRQEKTAAKRSYNLTIYYRGYKALQHIGIWDEIKETTVLVKGDVCHRMNEKPQFTPYNVKKESMYTIHREVLYRILLDALDRDPKITMHFNHKCLSVDKVARKMYILDMLRDHIITDSADIVIGADGINSVIRAEIQQTQETLHSQTYTDWGYKEVPITAEIGKILDLKAYATHHWPRKNSLFIAFPNSDSSFTLMINLPLEGRESFISLNSTEAIKTYISNNQPDLIPLLPEITETLKKRPLGRLATVNTTPWYFQDYMVLIGDAAHAVIPFFGQGMNAAFEDCLSLIKHLKKNISNPEQAFFLYQKERKQNTDVLAELSKQNFSEMKDHTRSTRHIFKGKIDTLLHSLFPKLWLPPLYKTIAFTDIPYAVAYEAYMKQERSIIGRLINMSNIVISVPYHFVREIQKNVQPMLIAVKAFINKKPLFAQGLGRMLLSLIR